MIYHYILYSPSHDRYYIGQTNHLEIRFTHHQKGDVKSRKPHGPWELVYSESYESRNEVVQHETYL